MKKLYESYLDEQEWHCPDCEKSFKTKKDKTHAKCFACGKKLSRTDEEYIGKPIVAKYLKHQYIVPKGSYDAGPKTTGDTEKVQGQVSTLRPELHKVQTTWNEFMIMASAVAPGMKNDFKAANDAITTVIDDLMAKCKKAY